MVKLKSSSFLVVVAVLLALGAFAYWLFYNPVDDFKLSLPGADNRGKGVQVKPEVVKIGDSFALYKTIPDIPGTSWPRFRGSNLDNISMEKIPLIEKWDAQGPKIVWKISMGEGHAAPAIYNGRVYVLDYDETKKADALRCFSLQTGEELWRRWYHVRLKRNHGLSRTIPTVTEKYVVTIGPKGQVMCVDRISGDFKWGYDINRELDSEIPFWYTGQCPLVENDTAIIATGGKSLMIGIDCKSGTKVWETPNPKSWKMSHSSILPMTYKGKRMYVYIAVGGICGVSASGSDKGQILWESTAFSPSVVAPSPVILEDGKIFFSAGYGAGSALVQVKLTNGKFSADVMKMYKPLEGLASEQQTPILLDGYLYGIQPKDAGEWRNQFVVCKQNDPTKFVNASGKTERYGLGPYAYADGKFFILNDDGELSIVKATPASYQLLDRKRIIEGQDSWGPLAITGGYLLMRDSKTMVCLDIRKR